MKFCYLTNISDLHIFDTEMVALLQFFEICTDMHFVFIFSKSKNITNSLLMLHLKCTVAHYDSLNSSLTNKPFLNHGSLNMLFCFFGFLIYIYFNNKFAKNFIKKLSFFNTNFQNSFQDVVYLQTIRMSTLFTLKW